MKKPEGKTNDWTDYHERSSRVTTYIYDHLDDELDLNNLAEVACLSPYHWHRVYHAMRGRDCFSIAASLCKTLATDPERSS
jgi:AraC-like DNA-binding protein